MIRKTYVAYGRLAAREIRLEAAFGHRHGVQVMAIEQLAARLAGGFLQPIDAESLREAIQLALPDTDIGELDAIKLLPGMVSAAADTLHKAWRTGLDLSARVGEHPRLAAIAALEQAVLDRLPSAMLRPVDLAARAAARLEHAPALFGEIDIVGISDLSPCWRELLFELAKTVPVRWNAGPRSVPAWLEGSAVEIHRSAPSAPDVRSISAASAYHEAIEALRWARELIASGRAKPSDIAIAAAAPTAYDDEFMALRADANLDLHFVHGVRVVTTRDGQAIAHPLARDIIEKLQALRRRINSTTPYQLLAEAIDVLRVRPILLQRHRGQAERPLANVDLYLSLAQPYAVRGLKAFGEAMTAAWEGKSRSVEGRPDAQEEAVSLVTMHASKGLEWPIVVPINTMTTGMPVRDPIVDSATGRILMPVFGVEPVGYAEAKASEVEERERERVRLWYVAATRARELLVLTKLDVAPSRGSWNALIDLDLDALPLVEIDHHPAGFETLDADPVNEQPRETFASEAAAVVAATHRLRWVAPSRDEDPTSPLDIAQVPQIVVGVDDAEPLEDVAIAIQGGRERGLIIHKLLEEVLTGETRDDVDSLVARARDLVRDLGRHSEQDPAQGLSATEMGAAVHRTLALPEIAPIRMRLVPELPVYGRGDENGVEIVTFGIVDALHVGDDGKPDLVIDWKSDVAPSAAASEHYRLQVRRYLEVMGIPRGMVVFVTNGAVLHVW